MDTNELAKQLESALDAATDKQRLEVLGKLGVELTDDDLEQVVGGVMLADGRLHNLLMEKIESLVSMPDILKMLDEAVASVAPNGLMGK